MTPRIALVDYGAGNLASVRKALVACGADVFTPVRPADLAAADATVVPGVGHFDRTRTLDESWRTGIGEALERGRPLLGICLGLQWLFEGSDEAPACQGLGLLEGRCALLDRGPSPAGSDPTTARDGSASVVVSGSSRTSAEWVKVPHVGWNTLHVVHRSVLIEGVPAGAQAYFTHSYAAPVTDACVAVTEHGTRFASVVERRRVFGVQFHPEKSGAVVLTILRNFLQVAREP